ncbi:MAG: Uma2 family endonuclease [Oculatellaceae cyanobacterium bins.114]|nr:Uma2 family endonuclease [Oculatellaceae cyanobacterium bins.114]
MTQSKIKFASFEEYLTWSDDPENHREGRFELTNGELVEVPPESEINNWIARCLMLAIANSGKISPRLIVIHSLELQVPILRSGDSANRYPDLVILRPEHLALTQKRLTITLDMPPPRLVAEVLSPGKQNRERDLIRKRDQYAACEIPEYWLIDPEEQTVTVLQLQDGAYIEVGTVKGSEAIASPEFPELQLTADQVFGSEA